MTWLRIYPEPEDERDDAPIEADPTATPTGPTVSSGSADDAATAATAVRRGWVRWLGLAGLVPVFLLVYYLAFCLRFDGVLEAGEVERFLITAGWIVPLKLAVFAWFRAGQGWRRPITFYDLVALVRATTCCFVLAVLVNRFLLPWPVVPRSIYLFDWGLSIAVLGGASALVRGVREFHWARLAAPGQVPAFIVGAGEMGASVLQAVRRNRKPGYRILGFLDDDPRRLGTHVSGVPVIGSLDETCDLARRHGVEQVLVVEDELPGPRLRQLLDRARRRGLEVRVLPSYERLIDGSLTVQPRPVAIDDLLHREPVRLDLRSLRRWIDGRTLLVTGSAGSIGSEICRQLLRFSPRRLVMVDRAETGQFFLERELRPLAGTVELAVAIADVLDGARVQGLLREHAPEIVFHAAAYKHVPLMESHPGEAVRNIVLATRGLADAAARAGVESFVMISTDKAVNPSSVMGATKRVAEMYTQALNGHNGCRTQFKAVRFGNVLGSSGSVVPTFRKQIAAGGPVTVTHPEMTRYFMTIPEASQLVLQAAATGQGGQIFLLDMGEPVKIVDLAEQMIRLSGFTPGEDIDIVFTGVRPGEKLFEELRTVGEDIAPTVHPKVLVWKRKPEDWDRVRRAVEDLGAIAGEGDQARIVKALRDLVPEYTPSPANGNGVAAGAGRP